MRHRMRRGLGRTLAASARTALLHVPAITTEPTGQASSATPAPEKVHPEADVMQGRRLVTPEADRDRERFFGEGRSGPLAIEPSALMHGWMSFFDDDEEQDRKPYELAGTSAVIEIDGPLQKESGWWWQGYDEIVGAFQQASADPAVRGILLRVSSPGGDVEGVFEALRAMQAAKAQSKKPVVTYVDECCCSAAYLLSLVSDAVWLPPTGQTGSIGVVCTLIDVTQMDRKDGIRVEVIASGEAKTDGFPHVPISDAALARRRTQVTTLAGMFAGAVAEVRGMTSEAVLGLQARVFMGTEAVSAGIADHVGGLAEALADLDARGAPTSPASRPVPTAGKSAAALPLSVSSTPPEETSSMALLATVIAVLGLSHTTTEAEAEAAVRSTAQTTSAQSAATKDLLEATGTTDVSRAVGTLQGWKAQAALVPELQNSLAGYRAREEAQRTQAEADAKAALQATRSGLIAQTKAKAESAIEDGVAQMRLTPAQADYARKVLLARDLGDLQARTETFSAEEVEGQKPLETPMLDGYLGQFQTPQVAQANPVHGAPASVAGSVAPGAPGSSGARLIAPAPTGSAPHASGTERPLTRDEKFICQKMGISEAQYRAQIAREQDSSSAN